MRLGFCIGEKLGFRAFRDFGFLSCGGRRVSRVV